MVHYIPYYIYLCDVFLYISCRSFLQPSPPSFLLSYCLIQNWVVRKGKNKPKDLFQHPGAFLARPYCTVRLISCLFYFYFIFILFYFLYFLSLHVYFSGISGIQGRMYAGNCLLSLWKLELPNFFYTLCICVFALLLWPVSAPIMLLVFPILWFLDLFNLLSYIPIYY